MGWLYCLELKRAIEAPSDIAAHCFRTLTGCLPERRTGSRANDHALRLKPARDVVQDQHRIKAVAETGR